MERRYNPDLRGGGVAWAALLAGVAAYDLLGNETLSNSFARGREHDNPLIRAATLAGLGYVALHLMDKIPSQFDPLDRITEAISDFPVRGIHIP